MWKTVKQYDFIGVALKNIKQNSFAAKKFTQDVSLLGYCNL